MPCHASFVTDELPIDEALCGIECDGCTFIENVSATGGPNSCTFEWTISRTGCSKNPDGDFSGSKTLGCPGSHEELFYCDPQQVCARLKLTLKCKGTGAV